MFVWGHLLKVAADLVQARTPTEAGIRSAINRAYYAALSEARDFANRHGYVALKRGGSNQRVWHFLGGGQSGLALWEAAAWKAIGDAGLALMARRVDADYRATAALTVVDARTAIAAALTIVRRVRGLP
jgi:hypothetical protein